MIVGLYLRHIKTYKNINFVPVGNHNFINYLGKNGSGKSSIIEAFDIFFNAAAPDYLINKSISSISRNSNYPFFVPIFLIEKSKIATRNKENFKLLSDLFWNIEEKEITNINRKTGSEIKEFFKLRDSIKQYKDTHFLVMLGETSFKDVCVPFFQNYEKFKKEIGYCESMPVEDKSEDNQSSVEDENKESEEEKFRKFLNEKFRSTLETIKKTYSYVYIPVESSIESFTKIETTSMQKIIGKTLRDEILQLLNETKFEDEINDKLNNYMEDIEKKLDGEYYYDSTKSNKKYLKNSDLFNTILETYFKIRVLNKGNKTNNAGKKISELSAGEKRQALLDLLHAFLTDGQEREKYTIIGIDEPENSLHTGLCFEQFEKLKEISKNYQIFVTTHWYGFLPAISEGVGHFLNKTKEDKVEFESYELCNYRSQIKHDMVQNKGKMPHDYQLKSMNDLVQSIFHSIRHENPYNWLICEGLSEKIYFDFLFKDEIKNKNLKILPMGGQNAVVRLYRYLALPIAEMKDTPEFKGKVFCIIDTDNQINGNDIGDISTNLKIKRFLNEDENNKTALVLLNNGKYTQTEIENALNPTIFRETLENLTNESKYKINDELDLTKLKNTDFSASFNNYQIKHYFNENNGENKIKFAEKYIDILKNKENMKEYIPDWVKEIKDFFN